MAKTFHLTIAKIGENLFDGEAISVIVPGSEGTMTVLANHEPFVTPLTPGIISVHAAEGGGAHTFTLDTVGLLEVSNNQATVII